MKKSCWTLAFVALLSLAAAAEVTKEEVRRYVAAGLPDDVILAFIRANGGPGRISADDLVDLKTAGASDRVLAAMVPPPATSGSIPVLYDRVSHCWIDLNGRRVAWATGGGSGVTLPTPTAPLPFCHPRCMPSIRLHWR